MPEIDLERLIVTQLYFIPIQRDKLRTAILNELEASDLDIQGLKPWTLVEEHKLSFHFLYSLKHSFIFDAIWGMKWETRKCKKLVKQKSKEFDEGGTQAFEDELGGIHSDIPLHIYVLVKKTEENGCLCKIDCLPTLYEKLRFLTIETNDFEMQNAYLACKRFLQIIFEGGLSATLVAEEKKELLKPSTELLINDQTSRQILDKIGTMLDQATDNVLICGWIGTILLPKLKEIQGRGINIRVITHKATKLKGQPGKQDVERAISELILTIGKDNVSIRPECHCRVLVVDNKALIGSMDLNALSLTGTHREIAVYIEDPEIVRTLRDYFKRIFSPLTKTE